MKNFKVGAYLAAMVCLGLGVAMAVTNPNQESYNQYAVKIEDSLRDLCQLLEREQGQSLLRQLVSQNTERQNYFLFSIYKTNLSTRDVVPSFLSGLLALPSLSYEFETVGLFSNFQIYRAERE
jgi:hypothetical protein